MLAPTASSSTHSPMTEQTTHDRNLDIARTFLLVTVAGALTAWDLGFEYGAFDTISYRRVLAVFVISTVVLATTFATGDDSLTTSTPTRLVLALPLIYVVADLTFLTASQAVADFLAAAVLLTFPYTLYVIAKLLGPDYFTLPVKQRALAAAIVVTIGAAGWYVGNANDRFLTCDDFERIGDYQPKNCQR